MTLQYLSLEEYEEFSAPGKPFDAVGLLKKGATAIKNLKLNGELIDTGEKLAQVKNGRKKIQPLADELITQLIKESEVSEDEEKNSEGQSNST